LHTDSDKAQIWIGVNPEGVSFYEVWLVRYLTKDVMQGGVITHKAGSQIAPSNENFGTYAWSYSSLERAITKFNSLI